MALKGGMINSYYNTSLNTSGFTGRITGGTGAYRGIQGTVEVRYPGNGRAVYIIRYTL
jgi:hypothetical protein